MQWVDNMETWVNGQVAERQLLEVRLNQFIAETQQALTSTHCVCASIRFRLACLH